MTSETSDHDATEEFLRGLPELAQGESFQFACHPGVPCFNACCSDLSLMLTPYDVLRLRKALGLTSREFTARLAQVAQAPDTGFPMLKLRMREEIPGLPCPFVTVQGCSVYGNRPGACRTYPLGRATKTNQTSEVVEQFFVVREPHCRGFEQDSAWTSGDWLKDQDLTTYNSFNDQYMLLLAEAKARGMRLTPKQTNLVFLAAYNLDAFKDFLVQMGALTRLDLTPEQEQEILHDEEARLAFATGWLELMLFGVERTVKKKT